MSVRTRKKQTSDREQLDSKEKVRSWERRALEGDTEEGIRVLEVDAEEDMSYPEDREVPGYTAPHSREDIVTVAAVYETESLTEAVDELEQYLEENFPDQEFLGPEDYGITSRKRNGRVLSRACYIE